jgi:phosphate transport system substrate-binding protein
MSSMHKVAGPAVAIILALASLQALAGANELPVVGTGDGIELLRALGAAYSADNPQTTIVVPPSIGSGGGLAAVGGDKEVLARVARPLTDSERALGLVSTPMFRLPSAFFVHRGANVSDLTARQLADIYAGKIVNWSEVGGANLRIKVVRREEADSTLTVLRQSMPGWKDLAITEKSKTAVTTQDCVNTAKDVEGAIGFGPYTKALEMELTVLRIDGKYPTDRDYPSAVTVSLVHKQATVTPDAAQFITYVKTAKAKTLLTSMGGVPALE